MRSRNLFLPYFLFACIFVNPLHAEPYWVAWEGNDFPENEGWERRVNGSGGPAIRTLHDGIMTMDGRADLQIDDYYRMERALNPELGEEFVMQWRLQVNEILGHPLGLYDPGVQLFTDDYWSLALSIGTDFVRSLHEGIDIPLEGSGYHEFEARSVDMQTYVLRIDGDVAHRGSFWEPTFTRSRVQWGDMT